MRLGRFEKRQDPLLPREHYLRRTFLHFGVASGLIGFSLLLGMAGYMTFEHLSMVDAFLNAAMLLGGMGPVNAPVTTAGKIFAGFYALYAGLVFLIAAGVIVAPVVHRLLHTFHWDEK